MENRLVFLVALILLIYVLFSPAGRGMVARAVTILRGGAEGGN